MCDRAGFVHLDLQRTALRERLQSMTDVIIPWGPDGEGHHVWGPVALGHRRLSIIDLQTGDQPMVSPDGSEVIAYNGEIYNYIELRDELMARGHTFRTTTDSEVIIHSYLEWGLGCQARFSGMWALALWDETRQRSWLSRYRLGEKSLHCALLDDTLIFGSEMKSLLAHDVCWRLDLTWSDVFCCFDHLPATHPFYRDIQKLPPASYLVCESGAVRVDRYWQLPELEDQHMRADEEGIKEGFTALLQDAVRIRMRSDVPFGSVSQRRAGFPQSRRLHVRVQPRAGPNLHHRLSAIGRALRRFVGHPDRARVPHRTAACQDGPDRGRGRRGPLGLHHVPG